MLAGAEVQAELLPGFFLANVVVDRMHLLAAIESMASRNSDFTFFVKLPMIRHNQAIFLLISSKPSG